MTAYQPTILYGKAGTQTLLPWQLQLRTQPATLKSQLTDRAECSSQSGGQG